MVNAQLVKYFEDGVAMGDSVMNLRDNLVNSGWGINEVDAAMAMLKRDDSGSLVSKFGKGRIYLAFFIFLSILAIISLVAMGSERVDITLDEAVLLQGKTLDVGSDLIEIKFDSVKSKTLRVVNIGVISVVTILSKERVKFVQDENQTIDLDADGKKDIFINLIEVKDGSPIFYFKLIEKKKLIEAESVDKEVLKKVLADKK